MNFKYLINDREVTGDEYIRLQRENVIRLVNIKVENDNYIHECDIIPQAEKDKMQRLHSLNNELSSAYQYLKETDFKVLKYIEGQLSLNEIEPIRAKRINARNEINRIEAILDAEGNING